MPRAETENFTENLMENKIQIKKNGIKYNCALFLSLSFLYGLGFISGYLYNSFDCDGSL